MSAFQIDDITIVNLASNIATDHIEATMVAYMLWQANSNALSDLYRGEGSEGMAPRVSRKQFAAAKSVAPAQLAKSARCYDYQACDWREYDGSPAAVLVTGLIRRLCEAARVEDAGSIPGYDDADWG